MSSVLFYDPSCQRPYDTRTLREKATGGTEASVTRIADALGAFVMQHNRTEAYGSYLPPGKIAGIEHVILNRDSRALPRVRELYPDAKTYLWVHDQLNPGSKRGRRLASTAQHLRDLSVTIICVSDTQRRGVEATVRKIGVSDVVRAVTIYNPVTDDLVPDGSAFDDRKLVFFSSPNKGLAFSLDAFRALRRRMPDLRLQVGNPGYKIRKSPALKAWSISAHNPRNGFTRKSAPRCARSFPTSYCPKRSAWCSLSPRPLGRLSSRATAARPPRLSATRSRSSPLRSARKPTRQHSRICHPAGAAGQRGLRTASGCLTLTSSASVPGVPADARMLRPTRASDSRLWRISGARCWGSREAVVGCPLVGRYESESFQTRLYSP